MKRLFALVDLSWPKGLFWPKRLCVVLGLMATGCTALPDAADKLRTIIDPSIEARKIGEEQRIRYQVDRDPEAMRWLLGHRVLTGMSVSAVNEVFGHNGERQHNDRRFKTSGRRFRRDDKVYRWGPDSDGNSVYLVFREDHVVNFNREDYLSSE